MPFWLHLVAFGFIRLQFNCKRTANIKNKNNDMATLRIYLDTRAARRDGTYPLKLSIAHRGTTALIPLEIWLELDAWDKNKQMIVKLPNRKELNSYVAKRKIEVEDIIHDLATARKLAGKTATQIRDMIFAELNPDEGAVLFLEHYQRFTDRHENSRTREIYQATRRQIEKYDKRAARRKFEDINKSWLDGFFAFMAETSPSVNARNIHLRNIRACFNDALDDEITTAYPFRKRKIRPTETRKRSLAVDKLREVFAADVPEFRRKYIDAFKLMFFLIGINSVDLCKANADNVQDGRLVYKRAKTGRLYSVKIEPEAAALIELYKGATKLLSFGEGCADYRTYTQRLNDNLKEVCPGLSTYWARHSWATIAASLDIPKETIAAALGHGGKAVTDIYINFDQAKVDEANRRVIDYVLYNI